MIANPPAPETLFRLAASNVIVSAWMKLWRVGQCSLEQALTGMVAGLCEQNAVLSGRSLDDLRRASESPFWLPRAHGEQQPQPGGTRDTTGGEAAHDGGPPVGGG